MSREDKLIQFFESLLHDLSIVNVNERIKLLLNKLQELENFNHPEVSEFANECLKLIQENQINFNYIDSRKPTSLHYYYVYVCFALNKLKLPKEVLSILDSVRSSLCAGANVDIGSVKNFLNYYFPRLFNDYKMILNQYANTNDIITKISIAILVDIITRLVICNSIIENKNELIEEVFKICTRLSLLAK